MGTNLNMKTYILLLLSLLVIFAPSCDDNDVMNTSLIRGEWLLQSEASIENKIIYNFTPKSEQTQSWGDLTVCTVTSSGEKIDEKFYDWHISDPKNDNPVHLDITIKDLNGNNDIWEDEDHYVVETLTAKKLILRKNEVGDSKTKLSFIKNK